MSVEEAELLDKEECPIKEELKKNEIVKNTRKEKVVFENFNE
jgi:hypothetical protein